MEVVDREPTSRRRPKRRWLGLLWNPQSNRSWPLQNRSVQFPFVNFLGRRCPMSDVRFVGRHTASLVAPHSFATGRTSWIAFKLPWESPAWMKGQMAEAGHSLRLTACLACGKCGSSLVTTSSWTKVHTSHARGPPNKLLRVKACKMQLCSYIRLTCSIEQEASCKYLRLQRIGCFLNGPKG